MKKPDIEIVNTEYGGNWKLAPPSSSAKWNGVIYVASHDSKKPGSELAYFRYWTGNNKGLEHILKIEAWQDTKVYLEHTFRGWMMSSRMEFRSQYSRLFLRMVLIATKIMNGESFPREWDER